MEEKNSAELTPNWNITSELLVSCTKCDFVLLIPLVAMEVKPPGNSEDQPKKSLFNLLHAWLSAKKGSGLQIFGFMCPPTKYCNKCRSAYVLKFGDDVIKLEDKYWEKFEPDSNAGMVFYLQDNVKHFNLLKQEACECGGLLKPVKECPVCDGRIKFRRKEVDGIPILFGSQT